MKPHILITGVSRGIGRACAEHFAAAGWDVSGVARNATALASMQAQWQRDYPDSHFCPIAADLATPAGRAAVPPLPYDVILLNAATYTPGKLLDTTTDHFAELLELNVLANHHLARLLLPPLIDRGTGHLVVIGSLGTDTWPGNMTAYLATKYALRGLFLGWQKDLAQSGILATLVAPGATLTSSWEGETPPENILPATAVAQLVWDVVARRTAGRIVIA
ncbi:SDR family oxidoreductase [Neolewinella lacunae]|uniref:SDR family oxidoreductase n=1 Tax=Neolewinella lacunae TaxID=1517758 RepID=A0A923PKU8_9BACT|nr:SDR family oxidoreductase [Neolewinella lacunae]MBC6994400.1 SDR family oxidoreductase [Neolewinella lacunae]MDN3633331.1 SDR family oxidoreductase [Neolewinella lacunae]